MVHEMSDTTPSYADLRFEDSWIDDLRIRLPYSFNRIEEKKSRHSRHFVLSEPVFLTGGLAAERHNYWRRGNVYYMSGKLLDYHSMSEVTQAYSSLEAVQLVTGGFQTLHHIWPENPVALYNSMQMEKVWGFAQDNILDTERVVMTNVTMAVELCLKAIMTHANFRETNCFKFNEGHNLSKLYDSLPCRLQAEITEKSNAFAKGYVAFRTEVEADIQKIRASHLQQKADRDAIQQAKAEWNQIAKRIRESPYTAFVNDNDPGVDNKYLHEGWFKEAWDQIKLVEDLADISLYFRYAPEKDKDELPPDLIHWVLLLGRFLYEYLFPVPPPANQGPKFIGQAGRVTTSP